MWKCNSCGRQAHHIRVKYVENKKIDVCNNCERLTYPRVYDCFIGGRGEVQYQENIADPKTGNPIPFSTKRQKAAILKRLNITEAGDRKHGAR